LFPAPPPGSRRFVRAGEVRDLLHAAGIHLGEHRFTGARQIVIGSTAQRPTAGGVEVSVEVAKQAERLVHAAIIAHLRAEAGRDEPWQVMPSLDGALQPSQIRDLVAFRGNPVVRGGSEPWVGQHDFELTLPGQKMAQPMVISAEVTLPPAVLVAVDAIPAGAVVRQGDVKLVRQQIVSGAQQSVQPLTSLDEAIGMETTRMIPTGQLLDAKLLRKRLLVHRNEVVTVHARAAGIQVRTMARARDDGAADDLVMVESLTDRARYLARVTGVREVDVYAGGIRAGAMEGTASRDSTLRRAKDDGGNLDSSSSESPPLGSTP
jgi:flagella basal body P-ring formation protein FlgA